MTVIALRFACLGLKTNVRSSMKDESVLDALLTREAVDVFENGAVPFGEIELRMAAREHRLQW